MPLTTAQIGRSGELLVQLRLLLLGIDSAPMSTDAGIDLVAYSPKTSHPATIQVKTNLRAKPGGGKGKAALDWWLSEDTPARLVALVDLSSQQIWLFSHDEIATLAQQNSSGRFHLYMYTDPTARPKKPHRLFHVLEFEKYLLQHRARKFFRI